MGKYLDNGWSSEVTATFFQELGGTGDRQVHFDLCKDNEECRACVIPCGQPFLNFQHCKQICQSEREDCVQSCTFLKHLRNIHPGTCPSAKRIFKEQEAAEWTCLDQCRNDADCSKQTKCCQVTTDCSLCTEPVDLLIGVPEIPDMPRIQERTHSGSVEVTWNPVDMRRVAPVLYMVQARWSVGLEPSSHTAHWQQLAQTTKTHALLTQVGLGRWYEFRVAAVSVNGTRGLSPSTRPFKLSEEPAKPGIPQNLTEGVTKLEDNKLSVMIHWQSPNQTDLPIARYKVFWTKRLRRSESDGQPASEREKKKVVPGHKLSFELEDLEQGFNYGIQVQAICAYGDVRLKSDRASLVIKAKSFQEETEKPTYDVVNTGPPTAVVEVKSLIKLSPLSNVTVDQPYFTEGQFRTNVTWEMPKDYKADEQQVLVHWLPEVCIADSSDGESLTKAMTAHAKEPFFSLFNLRFDCRYLLQLQLVNKYGDGGPISRHLLQMPSCDDIIVIGDMDPKCPDPQPDVPEGPKNLRHSFLIMKNNITARISWDHPFSDSPITNYRMTSGKIISDSAGSEPVYENSLGYTKVLDWETTSKNLNNLDESAKYMVRLQAVSDAGSGPVSTILFRTPALQTQNSDKSGQKSKAETFDPGKGSAMFSQENKSSANTSSAHFQFSQLQFKTLNSLSLILVILIWNSWLR